jgi:hypothetical protein
MSWAKRCFFLCYRVTISFFPITNWLIASLSLINSCWLTVQNCVRLQKNGKFCFQVRSDMTDTIVLWVSMWRSGVPCTYGCTYNTSVNRRVYYVVQTIGTLMAEDLILYLWYTVTIIPVSGITETLTWVLLRERGNKLFSPPGNAQ